MNPAAGKNSKLVLAAMIFAVSMTFIDQTIVAIAIPTLQKDVHLSTTGTQWMRSSPSAAASPTSPATAAWSSAA
jgi:hypothetical protein